MALIIFLLSLASAASSSASAAQQSTVVEGQVGTSCKWGQEGCVTEEAASVSLLQSDMWLGKRAARGAHHAGDHTAVIPPPPPPPNAKASKLALTQSVNVTVRSAKPGIEPGKRYFECYDSGSTTESRDAACDGDLKCARVGFEGRGFGDCDVHCCSKQVPPEREEARLMRFAGSLQSRKALPGQRYALCYDSGKDMKSRDAACDGELKCSRAGYDGRFFGDCETHCCSVDNKKSDDFARDKAKGYHSKVGRGGCPEADILATEFGYADEWQVQDKCSELKCAFYAWSNDHEAAQGTAWFCQSDVYDAVANAADWPNWKVGRPDKADGYNTKAGRGGCPQDDILAVEVGYDNEGDVRKKCRELKCAFYAWSNDPNEAQSTAWFCKKDVFDVVINAAEYANWRVGRPDKGLGRYSQQCWDAGSNKASRDAACAGSLVCARENFDERYFGDCPGAHCCSQDPIVAVAAKNAAPTPAAKSNSKLGKRFDECWEDGSDVESRDAACEGDLKCARAGFDGRSFGDCDDHCCSIEAWSLQTVYVFGDVETQACPTGYENVLIKSDCDEATLVLSKGGPQLAIIFADREDSAKSQSGKRGCYGASVWASVGLKDDDKTQPICKSLRQKQDFPRTLDATESEFVELTTKRREVSTVNARATSEEVSSVDAEARYTTGDCECQKTWKLSSTSSCSTHCCNPGGLSSEDWCVVVDHNCEGRYWGYCKVDEDNLPDGWSSSVDPQSGRNYFFKIGSVSSQWEKPVGTKLNSESALQVAANQTVPKEKKGRGEGGAAAVAEKAAAPETSELVKEVETGATSATKEVATKAAGQKNEPRLLSAADALELLGAAEDTFVNRTMAEAEVVEQKVEVSEPMTAVAASSAVSAKEEETASASLTTALDGAAKENATKEEPAEFVQASVKQDSEGKGKKPLPGYLKTLPFYNVFGKGKKKDPSAAAGQEVVDHSGDPKPQKALPHLPLFNGFR